MIDYRPTRRHFLGTVSGLAAAAAIGGAPGHGLAQGQATANVRMQRDVTSLDPGFMVGGAEIDVQTGILPALIEYATKDGQLTWVKTAFTKEISQSDDGLQIHFTLNPGFQWSNDFGELTAEDVKYSYERMATSDWAGNWEALDRVDVTDTYSGTIVLKQPFEPIWLNTLCGGTGAIICKKATEAAGGKFTMEVPATCGPYVYEWIPNQRVVLSSNPIWTGPKPDYDVINYIVINEDKAAELAYEAGEVDLTRITPETYARYLEEPLPDTDIQVAGALQYMWLGMNTEHPKLQDKRVRQAIQHAVDVESILQGAYAGVTERAYGIIAPPLPGRRTTTKLDYDPDKSKKLLEEAGISGLEIDLNTLNVQERLLAAQIIQANLGDVGVNVRVVPLDSGPFWDMGQESKGDAWKDLQLWLMRYGSESDPFGPFQWFVRDQIGVWNWERWSDDEFEELYAKGLSESDPGKRADIYVRMQEIMEDTGAYVWITHEPEVFVHRTSIAPDIWPTGQMNFPNFKRVG